MYDGRYIQKMPKLPAINGSCLENLRIPDKITLFCKEHQKEDACLPPCSNDYSRSLLDIDRWRNPFLRPCRIALKRNTQWVCALSREVMCKKKKTCENEKKNHLKTTPRCSPISHPMSEKNSVRAVKQTRPLGDFRPTNHGLTQTPTQSLTDFSEVAGG